MKYSLRIAGKHYEELKQHLFPGDGKEAVAIAICGRSQFNNSDRLLVHEIIKIPHDSCSVRSSDQITWPTQLLIPALERVSKRSLAILKIHSHPTGYPYFSSTDDSSDRELFESVFGWMEDEYVHGSAVMLPDGKIFGRIFKADLSNIPFDKVSVASDDIKLWSNSDEPIEKAAFQLRTIQAFGEGTTQKLKKLKVGVVGCSGTGSPTIELLTRLGVGELVLIDPDVIEQKNLNRIYNSTMDDTLNANFKVDVLKSAINRIGIGTVTHTYSSNIFKDRLAVQDLIDCDVIFGCVDSVDGRHLLNLISSFYLVPYFDLGVKLISDGKGGIDQIMGTVHYIQPGGSSLRTRGVYTEEDLRAAAMFRENREFYDEQRKSGYIVNINVDSPAVISINTQVSSMAINDFLARIHPFRYDSNREFAINRFSLTDGYFMNEDGGEPDEYLAKFTGRGDMNPFLNLTGSNW